jgi:hypothetical protein
MHFLRTWANLHVDLVSSPKAKDSQQQRLRESAWGTSGEKRAAVPHENPGFIEPNASV